MYNIPDDLLKVIFSFISKDNYFLISLVCKNFKKNIYDLNKNKKLNNSSEIYYTRRKLFKWFERYKGIKIKRNKYYIFNVFKYGDLDFVKYIISKNKKRYKKMFDKYSFHILFSSYKRGNIDILSFLYYNDIIISKSDQACLTYYYAAKNKNYKLLIWLKDHYYIDDGKWAFRGCGEDKKMLEWLLKNGY